MTLVAGAIANARKLSWETGGVPGKGRVSAPNWGGCITQIEPKGQHGGVGFKGQLVGLADASKAAVGGWDIRSKALGDALYQCRVLDYDLVRQVRDEMNEFPIMKGVYEASFLGESQHASAKHIVPTTDSTTYMELVEHLRNDIRYFKAEKNVTGHTTIIWSASVERPADVGHLQTAEQLLEALHAQLKDKKKHDISPSMLYATAAALEGCSFVNGGSQNTLGPAMAELYKKCYRQSLPVDLKVDTTNSTYLLGTDFKAGQTKFKTAAVEYLRALGLTPQVIASSNHLGNNDMLNLTNETTLNAKMRVKHSIFGPWDEEQLDHQVKVMYIPYMGDEKRDVVEYTSTAFLHQEHTMLTYTRCMDSVLCVPLMIDSAVWCDYFASQNVDSSKVAKATAYLFKIPEGGAQGVDPGFQHQMSTLRQVLSETTENSSSGSGSGGGSGKKRSLQEVLHTGLTSGIITEEQVAKLRALA